MLFLGIYDQTKTNPRPIWAPGVLPGWSFRGCFSATVFVDAAVAYVFAEDVFIVNASLPMPH